MATPLSVCSFRPLISPNSATWHSSSSASQEEEEEEDDERHKSLTEILLSKLRDDNPEILPKRNIRKYSTAASELPGLPQDAGADGMVAAEDEEEGPGDSYQAPENVEA